MRRVLGAYSRYYHRRHGTDGQLLEGRFRARPIVGRKSFMWRIAYVHKNHKSEGLDWRFSTHRFFSGGEDAPGWLERDKTLGVFGGRRSYRAYMERFTTRQELDNELRID
jgi:hypothetical protein